MIESTVRELRRVNAAIAGFELTLLQHKKMIKDLHTLLKALSVKIEALKTYN